MEQQSHNTLAPTTIRKISLIGTYVPRKCGIATFGADLADSLQSVDPKLRIDVFAMSDSELSPRNDEITFGIREQCIEDYLAAARHINSANYSAILLQHEYGIFGGESGSFILTLLRQLRAPIVTTLHTVLEDPSTLQRDVLIELIGLSDRVVVMSHIARKFLETIYDVDPQKIDMIPHGIPFIHETQPQRGRNLMGEGSPLIFTFGFLSPDKGIQHVIRAMPEILKSSPKARYVVMGETHPKILQHQGDEYRSSLESLIKDLNLSKSVELINRFATQEDLVDCLADMDYYITPYLNPRQITSGTLAYSIGAGKAVISTPYWYAKEILAEGRGVLVPFADHLAIATSVTNLEADREARILMGKAAAEFGEGMQWPRVAESYLKTLDSAVERTALSKRPLVAAVHSNGQHPSCLPALRMSHLETLTDDTGILQHARHSIPIRVEGYCTDDNARALLLTLELEKSAPLQPSLRLLQSRYLAFVLDAYCEIAGRFRNFMSFDRKWLERSGSEDSQGRALWSLGACALHSREAGRRNLAADIFRVAAPLLLETTSPRTWAYGLLGLTQYWQARPDDQWVTPLIQTLAERLAAQYEEYSSANWLWFEASLTYANARLPQALIEAGITLEQPEFTRCGLDSLEWLMDIQTDRDGVFIPIGSNGFYPQGGVRAIFDQQPVEALGSMSACLSAAQVGRKEVWTSRAHMVFSWFTGKNYLQSPVFDVVSGGCRDGIHEDRMNENQGAEATLSYLCALAELKRSNMHSTPGTHLLV